MTTELAAGTTLAGRYRIERLLGAGGMASVWVARDERLNRLVALKVISDTLAVDASYRARFEREARLAAGLSHANLVKVLDYGTESGRPVLVMEYVDGGTLAERIEGHRAVDCERLARELLAALEHVHRAGIVHRDVKPANVLFASDGRALLTDFGIAHPQDATRLTRTGNVVGTLRYMAPEVARGEPATVQSDLYSCGVLIREAAGHDLGGPLAALVDALSQPDPGRRPSGARDALALLSPTTSTRVLANGTEVTRPLTGSPTEGGWARGSPPRVMRIRVDERALAVGVCVLLLGLVAIVAFAGGGEERSPPPVAPAPRGAPLDQQLDRLERILREAGSPM